MSRSLLAIIFSILWSSILILALSWGTEYLWPDFVHVEYGYPLVWGVHTLNTLHGPVDIWQVNLTAFVADLAIWLSMIIVGLYIILFVKRRR